MVELDREKDGDSPEFTAISSLVLEKVIPRLLGHYSRTAALSNFASHMVTPRTRIPLLTATLTSLSSSIAGSLYAHNEYDNGNWRAARHRLSRNYKRNFPPSEPSMSVYHDNPLIHPLPNHLRHCRRILRKKTDIG